MEGPHPSYFVSLNTPWGGTVEGGQPHQLPSSNQHAQAIGLDMY